jgi:hypothetical protein
MPIFIKENQELNKHSYRLPKNLKKHLENTLAKYGQYKQEDGYKRLNSLINPSYNKRNNKKMGNEREISYTDLKRIDHDIRHMDHSKKNVQYALNGGDEMARFARDTLNRERTRVAPILKQEKVKTRNKNAVKPIIKPMKPIKLDNGVARIHESANEMHKYWDYLSDEYSVMQILDMFESKKNPWLPLINPQMYKKALQEFTKYGQLIHFPKQYIYQWMGIIMKNTAILHQTTELCGHSQWFPINDFVDYYFEGDYDKWDEYKESQGEDDDYYVAWDFLEERGFDDWNKLPDGSDALSDFGMEPLEQLIAQYDENMSPEEVLVLINKCLDIAHCRGDLASMFIQGGSSVLSQISEEEKKKKNIFITEKQLKNLKKYL